MRGGAAGWAATPEAGVDVAPAAGVCCTAAGAGEDCAYALREPSETQARNRAHRSKVIFLTSLLPATTTSKSSLGEFFRGVCPKHIDCARGATPDRAVRRASQFSRLSFFGFW